MSDSLFRIIEEVMAQRDSGKVHPTVKQIIVDIMQAATKHGNKAMSSQAVYDIVRHYGEAIGVEIAAHDMRRTFAKLCHKGGAPLEAISHALGHESLETTQRYLGLELDLDNAASDYLKLKL